MTDKERKNPTEEMFEMSQVLAAQMQEAAETYGYDCDNFWNKLTYDEQLMAFYSVVKRIHKGDVEDRRSFRGVLYDVFGFGPDAYIVGMECNYLDIHNLLYGAVKRELKNNE